ncbi:MAG: hypothetical protein ABUL67_03500 [Haliangium ochraceum]
MRITVGLSRTTILTAAFLAALVGHARADFLSPAENARRACESALAADEAHPGTSTSRFVCRQAMLAGGLARDFRNEVASAMAPSARPSLDDLVMAGVAAEAAARKSANDPWGALARCDIARKLGNGPLMKACLEDLRQVSPDASAVVRATGYATEHRRPVIVLLQVLLALGLLGTLVHALLANRRTGSARVSPSTPKASVGLLALAAIALLSSRSAHAEKMPLPDAPLSTFAIDDADPEASVPTTEQQNQRPLEFGYYLQDLAGKAEKAEKKKDWAAAARFYRALTKAAPMSAVGPRRMCYALQAAGDLKNAIIACRTALTRDGSTTDDYLHFVQVVLSTTGPLSRDEHKELTAVIQHLEGHANLGAVPWMFRCEIALRFSDQDELATCTTQLSRLAPEDPKTASFQWALAMQQRDRAAAREAIAHARSTGMNAAALQKMEKATRAMTLRWMGRTAIAALAIALIIAGSIVAFRRAARNRMASVQLTSET